MLVGATCLSDCVCLVIALFMNILAEVFVVGLVAVLAFNSRTDLFSEFHLSLALYLDSIVSRTEGSEEVSF